MNLIVDIGNTRTKYAVFDDGDWVECGLGLPEVYNLATTYRKNGKEVNLILSSTGAISAEVRERLREVSTFFCEVSSEIPLPIRLDMIPRRQALTGLPVVWAGYSFFRAGSCW
ncbi:MAG: hypothetical protein ACLUDU_01990 [Butyricimonas faecihominis]